jgi:hypothetical protein
MLVEKTIVNEKNFKKEFTKKFDNFCKKRPVLINYTLSNTELYLDIDFKKDIKIFEINYNMDVKSFIKEIDDWLRVNSYPVLKQVVIRNEKLSEEEVQNLIRSNIDIEKKVLEKNEKIEVINWRIEKIILGNDTFFIRNLKTNDLYRYKAEKILLSSFLKNIKKKWTPEYSWNRMQEFCEELNWVDPNFKK